MIDSECFLLVAKLKKWGPYVGGKLPLYEKETCGYCTRAHKKQCSALQWNVSAQDSKAGEGCFEFLAFHVHEQIPSLSLGKMWVTNKKIHMKVEKPCFVS